MYFQAMAQCVSNLRAFEVCLDKAEQFAFAKAIGIDTLLDARLAPDMTNLIYQVQSACDYVKAGAGWLSGQAPPQHEDNEQTVDDLRARIRKTATFADGVDEARYAGAASRRITWPAEPHKVISGEDYLLQIVIPNFYFHLSMAYAILRHNGVAVGKRDFLGPLNFAEA